MRYEGDMFKTKLLVTLLASLAALSACKKDEVKRAESAQPGETTPSVAETTKVPATEDHPVGTDKEPVAMTRDEAATRALAMFSKMAEAAAAANGDCDKIAADFTDLLEKGKPVLDASAEFAKDSENKKWFDENHGQASATVMTKMMDALGECMENEAVTKAMEALK